jgi:hypothetical protein
MASRISGHSGILSAYNTEEPTAPKETVKEAVAPCPLLDNEQEYYILLFMRKFGLSREVAEAQYNAFC